MGNKHKSSKPFSVPYQQLPKISAKDKNSESKIHPKGPISDAVMERNGTRKFENILYTKKILVAACTLSEDYPLYIADSECSIYNFPSPMWINPIAHARLVKLTNPGNTITIIHDSEYRVYQVEKIPISWSLSERSKQNKH